MHTSPTAAVVILNWNGLELLMKFLPILVKNTPKAWTEIWVADNGSTDESVSWLAQNFPQVQMVLLERNYGFAEGYNKALSQINANYYVLINSDIEVTPNWLEPCIRFLEDTPKLAAVQPKILSYSEKNRFEYAGAAGGYIDYYGYPFCRGRILSETEIDTGQYDEPTSLFWATGACLIIRAGVFKSSGGFDGDFFAHMEEIDLCWRLKNQGWKIGLVQQSTVFHLGGATLSYQSGQKIFLNFRNNLLMLVKNLPHEGFAVRILIRMVLDGVAALRFIAVGEWKAFIAVLEAHGSFYKQLHKTLKKRRALQPLVTSWQHPEIYSSSMVLGFYLKNQRKFTELPFNPPPIESQLNA